MAVFRVVSIDANAYLVMLTYSLLRSNRGDATWFRKTNHPYR